MDGRDCPVAAATPARRPWPKTLSAQVAAVREALAGAARPLTPAALAADFTGARPAALADVLAALVTLGHAHEPSPGVYSR